jgi:hypothetical protein
MTSIYLYAVIPTGQKGVFDVAGMGDDDDQVRTIAHDGIAAVVGASPLADYRGLKRDRAARYLVAHQRVVEAVMREYPVLPVKFGTVLADETKVQRFLAQYEPLLRTTLRDLAQQVQMEVVVLWDLQQVFQQIGQEARILVLKAEIAGRPAEETIVERVAVGQLVQASLQQRRATLRHRVLDSLRAVAIDLVVNPPMDDTMVVNAALLLDEGNREALDRHVEQLDRDFDGQLLFRCVGPLPPYSFAILDLQAPSFQMVDQARRLLGLGTRATAADIKRAYRRQASVMHPDHNHGNLEAADRTAALTQAYQLLSQYAQGWAQRTGRNGQGACSFDQQSVEETLLVSIRRQEASGRPSP